MHLCGKKKITFGGWNCYLKTTTILLYLHCLTTNWQKRQKKSHLVVEIPTRRCPKSQQVCGIFERSNATYHNNPATLSRAVQLLWLRGLCVQLSWSRGRCVCVNLRAALKWSREHYLQHSWSRGLCSSHDREKTFWAFLGFDVKSVVFKWTYCDIPTNLFFFLLLQTDNLNDNLAGKLC
jgi:hypothetical protein